MLAATMPQAAASTKVRRCDTASGSGAVSIVAFIVIHTASSYRKRLFPNMTINSGEQLHRDGDQALAVERKARLADDAQTLRDADHQARGVVGGDMAGYRAVSLPLANEAGDEAFVGLEPRADEGGHHRIDRGQFDRAADHETAAPPLSALGMLYIRQQQVAQPLAAVGAFRRRATGLLLAQRDVALEGGEKHRMLVAKRL